ncbi:hypothetical protein ACIHEI_33485 [Kitasatospora sp. NPDC051984]|uniref:hypothetical protein n=1 Tax=Kitasatospora sp. NPDC051984 TaxID=3364059 RepID=UPI0037C79CF5
MAGWGVTLAVGCECGAEARQDVGQALRGGELCWDAELYCRACGAGSCLGFGTGEAPPWVRDPLIAQHGTVRLRLIDPAAGRVAVLRTVREAWGLELSQARELAEQLAGDGLAGTLPEAAWLRERLAARGVPAEIATGTGPALSPWGGPR